MVVRDYVAEGQWPGRLFSMDPRQMAGPLALESCAEHDFQLLQAGLCKRPDLRPGFKKHTMNVEHMAPLRGSGLNSHDHLGLTPPGFNMPSLPRFTIRATMALAQRASVCLAQAVSVANAGGLGGGW